jgi:hypothetical protein
MYCSTCYENGKFTAPAMTADEMKTHVKGKLKEFGFPGFLAGLFTKNIPKLKRWPERTPFRRNLRSEKKVKIISSLLKKVL